MRRKERGSENTYQMSRWTPVVKDIVEEAIEDKLDNNHFPFLGGQRQNKGGAAPTSARYGGWHKDKKDQSITKTSPRIMVSILMIKIFVEKIFAGVHRGGSLLQRDESRVRGVGRQEELGDCDG